MGALHFTEQIFVYENGQHKGLCHLINSKLLVLLAFKDDINCYSYVSNISNKNKNNTMRTKENYVLFSLSKGKYH